MNPHRTLRLALLAPLFAALAFPAAADVYGWGGKEARQRRASGQGAGEDAPHARAAKGRQCASVGSVRTATALTDRDLVLHHGADQVAISHLPSGCDGLKAINNLGRIKLPKRGKFCSGETFEVWAPGDDTPTRCTFGPFERGTEMMLPELMRR